MWWRAMQNHRFLVFYAQDYPGARILEVALGFLLEMVISIHVFCSTNQDIEIYCIYIYDICICIIIYNIHSEQITAAPKKFWWICRISMPDFGQAPFFPELPRWSVSFEMLETGDQTWCKCMVQVRASPEVKMLHALDTSSYKIRQYT